MIEKLLGLASLGGAFASVSLLHRFLARLAVLLALTIVSALMAGVLLLGVFYGIYYGLTCYGLAPGVAVFVVGALMAALTATLVVVTCCQLNHIKRIQPPVKSAFPGLTFLTGVLEAFLEGYSRPAPSKRDKSL